MLIIYADGALLHHSAIGDKYNAIYEKKLKTEVNKAGSFEFVIPPTHALYDSLERFKTKIQIWQDSTLLFDGRVLEMNDTINNERKVYCEGNLSYLLDSLAAPYEGTMTVSAYLTKRIQEHNAQVEADKRFTLRTIDAELGAKTVDTQSTSYTDTRADLDENIINVYGGFLVTENQNGTLYLDYLKTIDVLGDQPLEFGFNLTDFTKNTPSTDVYSILLPTGDNDLTIESVNGGSKYIENATLIQKFGRIYHQESFNGITSAAELLSEATEYFGRVAQSILTPTFSIQVADFSNYTDGYAPFVVGRKYKMLSPAGEMCIYQAYTIDYDLDTFGNTTIEFVDPVTQNLSLNRRRSIGSSSSGKSGCGGASSKRAGSGGTSSGINLKYYHEGNDSAKIIASDIGLESSSTHIAVKDKLRIIATDGDWADFVEKGGVGSIVEVDPRGFRSISGLLTSAFGKFKGADGTAILQNMEAITNFAGKFTVDSEGVVKLKQGAGLQVMKNGVYATVVNEDEVTSGAIILKINGDGTTSASIKADRITMANGDTVQATITSWGAEFNKLVSGTTYGGSISVTGDIACGGTISGNDITVGGENMTAHVMSLWASKFWYVVADENISLEHSHAISISGPDSSGNITATVGAVQATAGTDSFNIAASQFVKNREAAAWTSAIGTVRILNSASGAGNQTVYLNPGDYVTVYAQGKGNANAAVYTTYGTVTVIANDSGGGGEQSDFQLGTVRTRNSSAIGATVYVNYYLNGSWHSESVTVQQSD